MKHADELNSAPELGRPRAGAWIETNPERRVEAVYRRPAPGGWIETTAPVYPSRPRSGRPRAGAWIETEASHSARLGMDSRPPRGGVD